MHAVGARTTTTVGANMVTLLPAASDVAATPPVLSKAAEDPTKLMAGVRCTGTA